MGEYNGSDRFIKSQELLFSDAQALPNNTNADSTNIIDLRGTNFYGNTPVWVAVDLPSHALAGGKYLDVIVKSCSTVGGTYTEVCRRHWAETENIEGRWFFGLVNPARYVKINYETTDDLSAHTVTAQIRANI